MGGGAMWRGVAKLLPPAAKVVVGASATTSCGFCKVNAPSQSTQMRQASGSRSCQCHPEMSAKSSESLSLFDADEWEFTERERTGDHLVFGTLPSRKEVEEASLELEHALKQGLVVSAGSISRASLIGSSSIISQVERPENPSSMPKLEDEESSNLSVASRMSIDWVEPPRVSSSQAVLEVGGRNVAEAFHQFQHNPEVKKMVLSLATDEAVWNAVLSNEQIQEFKRNSLIGKSQADKGTFDDKEQKSADPKGSAEDFGTQPQNFWSFWQNKMANFMDSIWSTISGLFMTVDKAFREDHRNSADRTIKICTVLAFIVLCVVIVKRVK